MRRLDNLFSLLFALCIALSAGVQAGAPPAREDQTIRGVWIPQPDHTRFWQSREAMAAHIDALHSAGINTLCVVVWNQGRTFFKSNTLRDLIGIEVDERLQGRDPLQEVIDAASRRGMRVYAWFEFGFATDVRNGRGREIIEKKPHWVARKADGSPLIRNGFRWMNAFDPEVQDFMLALMMEVVERYDVTGIQGDDRLPAFPGEGGYNDNVKALYAKAHAGRLPPADHKDAAWVQWRADRMGEFQARVYREAKRRKPQVEVTLAPPVFPWSRDDWLMDWPAWFKAGHVDRVFPQIYRKDIASYQAELKKIVTQQVPAEKLSRVHPGLLLKLSDGYAAPIEIIAAQVGANRAAGLGGEVYFFNEGVMSQLDAFGKLYSKERR